MFLQSTKIHGVISNETVILTTTFPLTGSYTSYKVEKVSLNNQRISQSTNMRE
jgi:hypothetical protein